MTDHVHPFSSTVLLEGRPFHQGQDHNSKKSPKLKNQVAVARPRTCVSRHQTSVETGIRDMRKLTRKRCRHLGQVNLCEQEALKVNGLSQNGYRESRLRHSHRVGFELRHRSLSGPFPPTLAPDVEVHLLVKGTVLHTLLSDQAVTVKVHPFGCFHKTPITRLL